MFLVNACGLGRGEMRHGKGAVLRSKLLRPASGPANLTLA